MPDIVLYLYIAGCSLIMLIVALLLAILLKRDRRIQQRQQRNLQRFLDGVDSTDREESKK